MESNLDRKKRKKFEPTSIALPAASAASIFSEEEMPLLPSAVGQSLCCRTSTGLTSHQIVFELTKPLSTIWLWLGVGTKTGAVGRPVFPKANKVSDRSTEEACMVQVPVTRWFGSGHCVVIAELTFRFHASGTAPKKWINTIPNFAPQSSVGLPPFGHDMASLGFWSLSTENIGIST